MLGTAPLSFAKRYSKRKEGPHHNKSIVFCGYIVQVQTCDYDRHKGVPLLKVALLYSVHTIAFYFVVFKCCGD